MGQGDEQGHRIGWGQGTGGDRGLGGNRGMGGDRGWVGTGARQLWIHPRISGLISHSQSGLVFHRLIASDSGSTVSVEPTEDFWIQRGFYPATRSTLCSPPWIRLSDPLVRALDDEDEWPRSCVFMRPFACSPRMLRIHAHVSRTGTRNHSAATHPGVSFSASGLAFLLKAKGSVFLHSLTWVDTKQKGR